MTREQHNAFVRSLCAKAPIIPVLVLNEVAVAKPLATALVAGGLPALEVTLRTENALKVITEMASVDGGIVGAGTLITPEDVFAAKSAGAQFGVSPGATDRLIDACVDADLPLLPGAATATEAMILLEKGFETLKFFPAQASGGAKALGAIGAPLPQVKFCPTGGVSPANAASYLQLPNVVCAGGSWVAPKSLIESENWAEIEKLARDASILGR